MPYPYDAPPGHNNIYQEYYCQEVCNKCHTNNHICVGTGGASGANCREEIYCFNCGEVFTFSICLKAATGETKEKAGIANKFVSSNTLEQNKQQKTLTIPYISNFGILIIDCHRPFLESAIEHHRDPMIGILALLESTKTTKNDTIQTIFCNKKESLWRSVLGWSDSSVLVDPEDCLDTIPIIRKRGYGISETGLLQRFKKNDIKRVILAGMDTDACVLAAAFNLWDVGIQPILYEPGSASSGGAGTHEMALVLWERQFGKQTVVLGKEDLDDMIRRS
jgi:isochorismate hydrolase